MSIKDDRIFEIQRGTAPAWPSLLMAFIKEGRTGMRDKAKTLTDALFLLEEPWRGRFLNLVANLATSWAWDGQPPTRKQVTNWLGTDLELYREMKLLLDAWHRPKK